MHNLYVLGLGKSGLGVALLARSKGYEVFASDSNLMEDGTKKLLNDNRVRWQEGGHCLDELKKADIVVKSPGIPKKSLTNFIDSKTKLYSDIEFGYMNTNAYIISVTGTNGKTTTVNLVYDILNSSNKKDVVLCGNIGYSFCSAILDSSPSTFVLELSSFQLDYIYKFNSNIAVIMNIDRDHMDRYENLQDYIESKFKIIKNQSSSDFLIFNCDDKNIIEYIDKNKNKIKSNLIPFSSKNKSFRTGAWVDGDKIFCSVESNKFTMDTNDLKLKGTHNIYNYMAAILVGLIKRCNNIEGLVREFKPLEHRMENFFVSKEKITFINDSKATNVHATAQAIDNINNTIIWIMGGYEKNNFYYPLLCLVRKKVKALICISNKSDKVIDVFKDSVGILIKAKDMQDAVNVSISLSKKGDVVLLSPSCSSIDKFRDYKHRGNSFKDIVYNIYR